MKYGFSIPLFLFLSILFSNAFAEAGSNHVKVGIGTDASLGLAFGAEFQLELDTGFENLRIGPAIYYTTESETSDNGFNTYNETYSAMIFGLSANIYSPIQSPGYALIYGGGVTFISSHWQETSETDSSIGPLIGGVYIDEEDGSGASVFMNFGVSKEISEELNLEVNVPLFFIPFPTGTILVPALLISVSIGI